MPISDWELRGVNEACAVIEKFAKELVPREMKIFGDGVALRLGKMVIQATPVRGSNERMSRRPKGKRGALQEGGRARGGWQGQVGREGGNEDPGESVKDRTGDSTHARGARALITRQYFEPFVWYNNVPYILILEGGRVESTKPKRGSLQAPQGMVAMSVVALSGEVASEFLHREFVAST